MWAEQVGERSALVGFLLFGLLEGLEHAGMSAFGLTKLSGEIRALGCRSVDRREKCPGAIAECSEALVRSDLDFERVEFRGDRVSVALAFFNCSLQHGLGSVTGDRSGLGIGSRPEVAPELRMLIGQSLGGPGRAPLLVSRSDLPFDRRRFLGGGLRAAMRLVDECGELGAPCGAFSVAQKGVGDVVGRFRSGLVSCCECGRIGEWRAGADERLTVDPRSFDVAPQAGSPRPSVLERAGFRQVRLRE